MPDIIISARDAYTSSDWKRPIPGHWVGRTHKSSPREMPSIIRSARDAYTSSAWKKLLAGQRVVETYV